MKILFRSLHFIPSSTDKEKSNDNTRKYVLSNQVDSSEIMNSGKLFSQP